MPEYLKEYFHGLLELVKKGSRLDRVVVLFFLAATIIYGGTKSPTNSPPANSPPPQGNASMNAPPAGNGLMNSPRPRMTMPMGTPSQSVPQVDIAPRLSCAEPREGVSNDFGVIGGAVVNEPWRRRGACSDWFRLATAGWEFRVTNRCDALDGLSVFANGEIRALTRTSYFPRILPYDVSLAPEANHPWPGAGADSRFWHAFTPSNSLVMTWRNALSNRVATSLVDFQAELFWNVRSSIAIRIGASGGTCGMSSTMTPTDLRTASTPSLSRLHPQIASARARGGTTRCAPTLSRQWTQTVIRNLSGRMA